MTLFRTYHAWFILLILASFLVFTRTAAAVLVVRHHGIGHGELKVSKSVSLSSDFLLTANERVHPLPTPATAKSFTLFHPWNTESNETGYFNENQNIAFLSSLSGLMILQQTCKLQI